MVNIIYGRAGTGKTHSLEKQAESLSGQGTKVFFVVPEQLTVSREYSFSKNGFENTEVQSFSRLADTVMRALGGTAKKMPDSAMSAAALYRSVLNVYDSLTYYKRVACSDGFINKLKTAFAEFDTCRISLPMIEAIPNDELPGSFMSKYRDLFMIYNEYKRIWDDEYKAPGEDLTTAAQLLEQSELFAGSVFMFDSFYGFTRQQLDLIEQIIKQCSGCYFAFTTDLEDELFSTVTEEAYKISRICKKTHTPCVFEKVSDIPYRLKTESQRFIQKYWNADSAPQFDDNSNLTVYAAKNRAEELNFIACKIKNDVLCGKYRFRDIAVLSTDSQGMAPLVKSIFSKHETAVFADTKKSLLAMPLTAMVLSAVETAFEGFTYENVFSFLKTGLAGLSFDDINILESYVQMWKIKGGGWFEQSWTRSPSGLDKSPDDKQRLEYINSLREKTVEPLKDFCDSLKKSHGCRDMLTAVCRLFDRLEISSRLVRRAQYFESTGDMYLGQEYSRVYEIFIKMLDSIDSIFKNDKIDIHRFHSIIKICAGSITVSSSPACVDEVIFSGIGRVRTDNIKCVYICGMNDGLLPASPSETELITDMDKRILGRHGITTSLDFVQSTAREKFNFYSAMMSASHELVLSYSAFAATGEPMLKSEFLENIERVAAIKELSFESLDPHFHLVSISAISDYAAATANSQLTEAVYEAAGIPQTHRDNSDRLSDDIVYGLYSKNLRLSFSGMEEYIECPFKFFVHRGLRAHKNEPVEMNPANIGSFIHSGLETLLSGKYDLDGNIDEHINEISENYYNNTLADCKDKSKRFDWMFLQAKKALNSAAVNIVKEIHSSEFKPFDFEIDISQYTRPAQLENGCTLTLVGSIDRVDMLEKDGRSYAKIIDYKSGSQEFSLKKIYNGLSMQLPIYAAAVKSKFDNVSIAAMYYLKVGVLKVDYKDKKGMSESQYLEKADDFYKRDGIFSKEAAQSFCLGGDISSLNKIKKDRIISQSGIDSLIEYTQQKIYNTGNSIMSGKVDISPISDSKKNSCQFCDYSNICKISKNPDCIRQLEEIPEDFLREEKLQ